MFLNENVAWEISLIGLSLSVFTLFAVLSKPQKHKTDLLLCGWLVLLNIPLLHTAMGHLGISSAGFNHYTNPTLNLLHGPLLYLYVHWLISEERELELRHLLHLIPFAVFYLVFILMPHPQPMVPFPDRPYAVQGGVEADSLTRLFAPILKNFGVINGLLFLGYSILTFRALVSHQQKIADVFSQNDNRLSLKWIFALPIVFFTLAFLNFINENAMESAALINPLTMHMLSFLSFIVMLCFFGVRQRPVFPVSHPALIERTFADSEAAEESDSKKESEQSEHTLLADKPDEAGDTDVTDEDMAKVLEKMRVYMAAEKPYLDPEFSVYTLAEALKVPRRYLSMVLNQGHSKNFYQYVNEFRIEAVKVMLENPAHQKTTILDIAFESGFKSKSSFNSLFKQHCGVTPTQYRKKFRNSGGNRQQLD